MNIRRFLGLEKPSWLFTICRFLKDAANRHGTIGRGTPARPTTQLSAGIHDHFECAWLKKQRKSGQRIKVTFQHGLQSVFAVGTICWWGTRFLKIRDKDGHGLLINKDYIIAIGKVLPNEQ